MDLLELLNEHGNFHLQIQAENSLGERTEEQKEAMEMIIASQLQQITNELGVKGVADLVHVVHELIMETLVLRPPADADPEDMETLHWRVEQLMEWVTLAALTGKF